MTDPVFGVVLNRATNEILPVLGADFSKIGIVTTSADANGSIFPINTPVRFTSTDPVYVAALGTGYLRDAVVGINAQLASLNASADLIVVRVTVGGSLAATQANVVTGLTALRTAPEELGATPRIIICPGYTSQTTSSGGSINVSRAAKAGGNTGGGDLTLAGTPHLDGVKAGVYQVRVTGGAKSATAAAKAGGNTGNGTVGSLTADTNAPVGAWRVICGVAAANGGSFTVLKPDGTYDGIAVVGSAYNSTSGPNFTIADGSEDFVVGDEFVITVVASVPSGGGAFSVTDPDGIALAAGVVGTPYTTQIAFTLADGTPDYIVGDGFDVTVAITAATITANPVVAALPATLGALLAFALVDAPDSSRNAAVNWRETVNSDRIHGIAISAKVQLEDGSIVTRPMSPYIAGLMARSDNAHGGRPFHPIANQPIYGIVGVNRNIPFSLVDGATEGQLLLGADLGIVVRGQIGVDTAIADGGFVYIGTDSCAEGELWAQFHQVRGADYISVKLLQIARLKLGSLITADSVEAWLNSIKFMLSDHKALGDILGFKVEFKKDLNSPEQVRLGRLTVTPHIEPAPAFKKATHLIHRYRPAVDDLVNEIIARLGATV